MTSQGAALGLRQPEVLTKRVAEVFLRRVLCEERPVSSLTLVSPWISELGENLDWLARLRDYVALRQIRTLILTRPPDAGWHRASLDILSGTDFASIYLVPDLHAKLFVCEAVPVGFAVVGSANLTARGLVNVELGVLFEARGELTHLVRQLRCVAWHDLRRLANARYVKGAGG
jgi:hypothetical protein